MKTFLTKIAQLGSILDVSLLSHRGELLFAHHNNPRRREGKDIEGRWREIISSLDKPATADFIFAKGRYYLQNTPIGYLIVGMLNDSSLNKVRIACSTVSKKLANTAIRKQTLLKLLMDTDNRLKPHVIKELIPLADRSVASALISLLKQRDQFEPDIKQRLLLCTCQALGYCNSSHAIEPLQTFLATDGDQLAPNVASAARIAIRQLQENQPENPPSRPIRETPHQQAVENRPAQSSPSQPSQDQTFPVTTTRPPVRIDASDILQNGNKAEAMARILEQISTAAKNRDFLQAEQLRNRLIKIDSLAVGEIIRAAEIIDEERKAAIHQNELHIWRKLIDNISAEAFSALYHVLEKRRFADGEMVAEQGDLKPALFFINSGKVQVHIICEGKREPVAILEPGTAFGSEAFFELSVWTFGVKSLGAEIFILSPQVFQKLIGQHPTLEAKLADFARLPLQSHPLFTRGRKSRRQHERKSANNRVAFELLDAEGNETGQITKGDLIDISQGGLALSFHASQKKTAASLLGEQVKFSISCRNNEPAVSCTGIVKAIGSHDPIGNLYSMHVELTRELTGTELRRIGTLDKKSL